MCGLFGIFVTNMKNALCYQIGCMLEWKQSELSVYRTAEVFRSHFTGFHENALHGFPVAMLAAAGHRVHFSLAVDRPAVLLARHWQQSFCGSVLETHRLVTLPYRTLTQYSPLIQMVTFTILSKGTDFLNGQRNRLKFQANYFISP